MFINVETRKKLCSLANKMLRENINQAQAKWILKLFSLKKPGRPKGDVNGKEIKGAEIYRS